MASKRHQESGAEKRKKKRKRDDANAALAGSMLKFVQGGAQGQEEDLEQPSTSRSSPHQPSTSWSADFATAPSPDQQPSTTSSGTDTTTHTATASERVVSPVTERPSASDTGETYVPPLI